MNIIIVSHTKYSGPAKNILNQLKDFSGSVYIVYNESSYPELSLAKHVEYTNVTEIHTQKKTYMNMLDFMHCRMLIYPMKHIS